LLKYRFPDARYYDLLKNEEFERLLRRPQLLREELVGCDENTLVIIDEVQKIPQLLDEVHWLIVNQGVRFILCSSSARKLKRVGTNLLGGRALTSVMFPLVSAEIDDFDLIRAVNNGMIPRHYMIENPSRRLQAYIGVYLNEEIRIEAQLRNISSFTRFLEVAAQCDGEIVKYTNIAQDCGVSAVTVKEYFAILEQTLIGYMVPAFTLSKKRRAIGAPKFYYFDVGIVNYLQHRSHLTPGSDGFGHAFEHFIIQEIIAYVGYHHLDERISYWHTTSGYEVDCVIGEGRTAIGIKSSTEVQSRHLKGLRAFNEDFPQSRLIIVSLDANRRTMNGVEVIPALQFLSDLWKGKIF
jgi:predicted AAA+ superfamily ATPase